MLNNSDETWLPVNGNSMYPLLKTGDFVLASNKTPSVGDLVLFKEEGCAGLIIHRLISERNHSKGDYSTFWDSEDLIIVGRIIGVNGRRLPTNKTPFARTCAYLSRLNSQSYPGAIRFLSRKFQFFLLSFIRFFYFSSSQSEI